MISLSQSGLNAFRNCPFSYKCYRERKQGMFWDFDILDIGKHVHHGIEKYYKNHFDPDGKKDYILYYSYERFKEVWDFTFPPEYLTKAYNCLENHAIWEADRLKKEIGNCPLVEVETTQNGFHGIIDYVDLAKDKVIDWKTNSYAVLSHEYRIQASIYKILYDAKFDKELTHFYFFFLYPNEWRTVKYDSEKQNKVKEEVMKLKDAVEKCYDDGEFPKEPRTESMCKNCIYKWYCRYAD